jgi:hypothetical protein
MKANHIGDVDVSVLAGMRKIVCSSRDGVQLPYDNCHDGPYMQLCSEDERWHLQLEFGSKLIIVTL